MVYLSRVICKLLHENEKKKFQNKIQPRITVSLYQDIEKSNQNSFPANYLTKKKTKAMVRAYKINK